MSARVIDSTARQVALRGDLLDFTAAPAPQDLNSTAVRWRPDHWLLIDHGRIEAALPASQFDPPPQWYRVEHPSRLIMPGFIDTHVHSAQIDVLGSWGTQLLDWLHTHTFPAEQRMAHPEHAQAISQMFVRALLAQGTTAACVFPSVHAVSADALFAAAHAQGMRMITGKVLMDRNAPAALCDTVEHARADCEALIARWHGTGRLAYAVTPRFAITSTPEQLALAGQLWARTPGSYLQTHVAENTDEAQWVAQLFPQARSYLDVYAQYGLLGERAVLAHGLWLDEHDHQVLADSGAQIAHCPSSNLFLGSGLLHWDTLAQSGIPVTLASDVGGGTSLAQRRTMLDAYKGQAMRMHKVSAFFLLHACTRGAAEALRLEHEIGSLEPGTLADVAVWDWASTETAHRRQQVARDLHERLFAWITAGDEADLVQTWVAGIPRHVRSGG